MGIHCSRWMNCPLIWTTVSQMIRAAVLSHWSIDSMCSFTGLPAVILLCRGLFGKNLWTLNFRQNPISNPPMLRNKVNNASLLCWSIPGQGNETLLGLFSPVNECSMKTERVQRHPWTRARAIRKRNFSLSMERKRNERKGNDSLERSVDELSPPQHWWIHQSISFLLSVLFIYRKCSTGLLLSLLFGEHSHCVF